MGHKEKRSNNRGDKTSIQISHNAPGTSKHKGSKKPTNQKRRKR